MKKIITILLALFFLAILGILIPILKTNNLDEFKIEEQKFANYSLVVANDLFDNPIEKLIIIKLKVREIQDRESDAVCEIYDAQGNPHILEKEYFAIIDAYTFFGIHYASAVIECHSNKVIRNF